MQNLAEQAGGSDSDDVVRLCAHLHALAGEFDRWALPESRAMLQGRSAGKTAPTFGRGSHGTGYLQGPFVEDMTPEGQAHSLLCANRSCYSPGASTEVDCHCCRRAVDVQLRVKPRRQRGQYGIQFGTERERRRRGFGRPSGSPGWPAGPTRRPRPSAESVPRQAFTRYPPPTGGGCPHCRVPMSIGGHALDDWKLSPLTTNTGSPGSGRKRRSREFSREGTPGQKTGQPHAVTGKRLKKRQKTPAKKGSGVDLTAVNRTLHELVLNDGDIEVTTCLTGVPTHCWESGRVC